MATVYLLPVLHYSVICIDGYFIFLYRGISTQAYKQFMDWRPLGKKLIITKTRLFEYIENFATKKLKVLGSKF